jgi:hypothetical protein
MKLQHQYVNLIGLITTLSLSVAACWISLHRVDSQPLGVVDLHLLIQLQSQQLARSYPNGQVPPGVIQQVVEDIKTIIKNVGQHHNITLLAKGAVLSGEHPDYTQAILNESTQTLKKPQRGGMNEQRID